MSPELRLHYLQSMGIQCWQDRVADNSEIQSSYVAEPSKPVAAVADLQEPALQPAAVSETLATLNTVQKPDWNELARVVSQCSACELHQFRSSSVLGEGADNARVMVLSLAPQSAGARVQLLSQASTRLFDAMLKSIGLTREQIYFTTLLKCTLPEQREPRTTEVVCCESYLQQQIDLVQPRVIISLGETCAQNLLVKRQPLQQLQQRFHQYHSVPVLTMNHPEDLLSDPLLKRQAWHDLLRIKQKLAG